MTLSDKLEDLGLPAVVADGVPVADLSEVPAPWSVAISSLFSVVRSGWCVPCGSASRLGLCNGGVARRRLSPASPAVALLSSRLVWVHTPCRFVLQLQQ